MGRYAEAHDPRKSSSVGSIFDSPQDDQKPFTSGQESHPCATEEETHERSFQEIQSVQGLEEPSDTEDIGFHMQLLHSPYKSPRDAFQATAANSRRSSQASSLTQGNTTSTTSHGVRRTTSEDSPQNESEFYFCFKLNTLNSQEEEVGFLRLVLK